MALDDLRSSPMMSHLLEALEAGKDVGHYGRLLLAIVGRYFLAPEELVAWLEKDPACDPKQARALCHQVLTRRYNPPRRETVLEWQARQEFPICPAADPDACNLYRDLEFPPEVYADITDYHAEKLDF